MNVFEELVVGLVVVIVLCWIFPPFQLLVFFYILYCIVMC